MPTGLLTYLQETSLALWVSQSPSLLGYPTILTFHTVGLALLVGGSVAIDLQLLGVARAAPLSASAPLFRLMWPGLAINGLTGLLLFMADAVNKAQQPVFWVKLVCIGGAVAVLIQIRAVVAAAPPDVPTPLTARGRTLALVSLVFWVGAIVAGRLMAYLK
jgi:uncharacterized membrane protein